MAEQERLTIRKRQAEGIAIAKKAGKYKGKPPLKIDEDKLRKLFDEYKVRKITKVKMAKELGISRPTLNRVLDRYGLKI